MITQFLLDVASLWVGGALGLLPEIPVWLVDLSGLYQSGVSSIINTAAPWGVIVPYLTIVQAFQWWVSFITFYIAVQTVRFVLWVIGR